MLNVYQFVLNLEMVILQVNYSQLERFFHENIYVRHNWDILAGFSN